MTGDLRESIEDHARASRLLPIPDTPKNTPVSPRAAGGQSVELQRVNPACGDRVRLRLSTVENDEHDGRPDHDGGTSVRLHGDATGCTLSRASASLLAEVVDGQPAGADAVDALLLIVESFIHRRTYGPWSPPGGRGATLETVTLVPLRVDCVLLPWLCARDLLLAAGTSGA